MESAVSQPVEPRPGKREPFVTITFRVNDTTLGSKEVLIRDLSDDDLLSEYAAEEEGMSRACGGDPPSKADELSEEIRKRMKRVSIEVYQQDFMPGWGAYVSEDGELRPDAKPVVLLNVGGLMAAVQVGDLDRAHLPYMIAETLMHEVIHVLEHWAGVEFSEERVEHLLDKYRIEAERETVWQADCKEEHSKLVWIDPEILSGTPCLVGSRIPVAAIVSQFCGGKSIECLAADYTIARERIEDGLKWWILQLSETPLHGESTPSGPSQQSPKRTDVS